MGRTSLVGASRNTPAIGTSEKVGCVCVTGGGGGGVG